MGELHFQEAVEVGQRFHLVLTDALDESHLAIEAEVVWLRGERAGFRWVSLKPEQDSWLAGRFQAWIAALIGASRR